MVISLQHAAHSIALLKSLVHEEVREHLDGFQGLEGFVRFNFQVLPLDQQALNVEASQILLVRCLIILLIDIALVATDQRPVDADDFLRVGFPIVKVMIHYSPPNLYHIWGQVLHTCDHREGGTRWTRHLCGVAPSATARVEQCIDDLWEREILEVVVELDALITLVYFLLHFERPLILGH